MKRADARMLSGLGIVLCAGGVALLALVASALRRGTLDARHKHAPRYEPEWILASKEPAWFYSILALTTILAVYLLVLSWRMITASRDRH